MTNWWNNNAQTRIDDFKAWVGDTKQPSKLYCRNHIINYKYKTIIDCGCGLATDYFGFKEDQYEIDYTGLDSCKYFVETNRLQGITMLEAELEENLNIPDNSYDVAYCREILEHLSYYDKTLNELIRIAKKEVIIVFFIKPDNEEQINYWEEEDLYHNKYDKEKLETFINNNPKVSSFFWKEIQDIPYSVEPIKTSTESAENSSQENLVKPTGEKIILHIVLK